MSPTLRDGNVVLVKKTDKVKRFDVVYFQQGNVQQIRRIIGLPGESIEYKEDTLYVDGKALDEKFIVPQINEAQSNGGQYTADFKLMDLIDQATIPEECYLVLSDNRSYGSDSRQYGLITNDQLLGVLRSIWLPLTDARMV